MIVEKLFRADKTTKSAFLNMIFRPISVVLTLIYTPLLLDYLGEGKFGLWVTIMSMISWINYFDVGIGNGLRDVLAKDIARDDKEHAGKVVSTAYLILTAISLVIFFVIIVLIFALDWKFIFSTTIDMRGVLFVSFAFICVNFVLALMNMILYALQMSVRVSVRACLIQLLNIIFIIVLKQFTNGNLLLLAFFYGFSTSFINIFNSIQILKKHEYLSPRLKKIDISCVPQICNIGLKFFVIQIMCMLMFTVDDLLITHFWGAESLTPFSMANKVYNTGYSFLAAFLVPYWSGTTKAMELGDVTWIKKSVKKAFGMWSIYSIGCILMIWLFHPVMRLWLNKELNYPKGIVVLMCIFYILYGLLAVECQFINGTGKINLQLIMYIILGVANIPFSIALGVGCSFGVVGIRLATTILILIADIVLGINMYLIFSKRSQNKVDKDRING